jgi:hypothetical protein
MKAILIARAKEIRDDGSVVEIVVWRLTQALAPHASLQVQAVLWQRRAMPGAL